VDAAAASPRRDAVANGGHHTVHGKAHVNVSRGAEEMATRSGVVPSLRAISVTAGATIEAFNW
jgi:hypothetical protein